MLSYVFTFPCSIEPQFAESGSAHAKARENT